MSESTMTACKVRHLLGVFLMVAAAESGRCAQSSDTCLTTFQQFVNGKLPIKEAVVFRELSRTNGTVINREWWRFGYQEDTWFVQRLIPGSNGVSALVPRDSDVCGASFRNLWTASDKNVQIAAKNAATRSVPEQFGKFDRNLMWEALSLGIPRRLNVITISQAPVDWNGLQFKTSVTARRDKRGSELMIAPLTGQLKLGERGAVSSAASARAGDFPDGTVTYEYASRTDGIPESFCIHLPGEVFRYKFLSLTLGSNDLAATGGYEPSRFVDTNQPRLVTFFTNELAYTQTDGKSYPAFRPPPPELGKPAPPLHGTNWFNATAPLTLEKLRGKVVLLDFWSLSCPSCIAEFPRIGGLYQEFNKQGLMVIGVCCDWGSTDRVSRLLKSRQVSFPNLMDADFTVADLKTGHTTWNYVLDGSPSYALIGRSGKLVWKSTNGVGPTESQLKELLAEAQAN